MELTQLMDEVISVLRYELDEKDFTIFILKVLGGMSNVAIGRAVGVTESSIRKRFKNTIEITLRTKTSYIYEDGNFVDTTPDGYFIQSTAKMRNANLALSRKKDE